MNWEIEYREQLGISISKSSPTSIRGGFFKIKTSCANWLSLIPILCNRRWNCCETWNWFWHLPLDCQQTHPTLYLELITEINIFSCSELFAWMYLGECKMCTFTQNPSHVFCCKRSDFSSLIESRWGRRNIFVAGVLQWLRTYKLLARKQDGILFLGEAVLH